jgi:hypothetical protein
MGHYTKSDGSCWLQRYAATRDEALHNYPATHFGRNPPPSTIQSCHWKRRGLEPVPDPKGQQDTSLSETSPQQAGRSNLPKTRVVSMGRRNTQLRPTFLENKS